MDQDALDAWVGQCFEERDGRWAIQTFPLLVAVLVRAHPYHASSRCEAAALRILWRCSRALVAARLDVVGAHLDLLALCKSAELPLPDELTFAARRLLIADALGRQKPGRGVKRRATQFAAIQDRLRFELLDSIIRGQGLREDLERGERQQLLAERDQVKATLFKDQARPFLSEAERGYLEDRLQQLQPSALEQQIACAIDGLPASPLQKVLYGAAQERVAVGWALHLRRAAPTKLSKERLARASGQPSLDRLFGVYGEVAARRQRALDAKRASQLSGAFNADELAWPGKYYLPSSEACAALGFEELTVWSSILPELSDDAPALPAVHAP